MGDVINDVQKDVSDDSNNSVRRLLMSLIFQNNTLIFAIYQLYTREMRNCCKLKNVKYLDNEFRKTFITLVQ